MMVKSLKFFKNNDESKPFFLKLNTQNKLLIFGSLLSSVLVIVTAWTVIDNTQKRIIESYNNFGSMMGKTLAIEGADMLEGFNQPERLNKFKKRTNLILKTNNDILYIIFRDAKNNIKYSSFRDSNGNIYSSNEEVENLSSSQSKIQNNFQISQPIISEINNRKVVIGSVQLGLTESTLNVVGKATRNLMVVIFTVAWILSIAAVLINTLLVTRQIKLLVDGVRRISTGEFGYKITTKDLWGEIKELFNAFNDMSVRLSKYEEKNIDQLTYERNKLESILMSIANGVVVCDNYDNVILVNNSALKMLELERKEILETKVLDYYDTDGNLCFKEEINKFKETPLEDIESRPLDFQVSINNRIFKTTISPIFAFHQEYLGYIIVLHDITKETEIDKLKNHFISNVSHELRTPVTVLRSYIDTLHNYSKEFDEETKQEFLSIMDQEADRLNRTVNDILDFSRLESPNVELEKVKTDIGPIIEVTVKSMRLIAQEKNVAFSIIIEPDLPPVLINAESIERVLKNLISNAIKYSPDAGRIKIRAEIDRTGTYLQVSIEDNGIGIPEKHLTQIFDRFYRVENKTHTIKGTGLGLHLVKIAIEKHHKGIVFVESKVNEGSTFGFRIHLKPEEIKA